MTAEQPKRNDLPPLPPCPPYSVIGDEIILGENYPSEIDAARAAMRVIIDLEPDAYDERAARLLGLL